MKLAAFQNAAWDDNGNPGIPITGCPNCGKVPPAFRHVRYLTKGAACLSPPGSRST